MRSPLTDRSGYTVIEMLMVMVIIAIIAAITYVRVAPALERARVRGAASTLATDLQYAQVLAARFRAPIRITVNGGLEYTISDPSGSVVYRQRRFGTGGEYELGWFTAVPASVHVFPNSIVDQSAEYRVGLNGFERRITFSRAGQIRVTTP
jgi:prepilin-type N-terminal cleavage/methylation domain-containing protein